MNGIRMQLGFGVATEHRMPNDYDRCGLTAKQVPHRPGLAPALGLRARVDRLRPLAAAGRRGEAKENAASRADLAGPTRCGRGLALGGAVAGIARLHSESSQEIQTTAKATE